MSRLPAGDARPRPRVGVLALQGDVREHLAILTALGAEPRPVRRPGDLDGVQALVLPGGESTTMQMLMHSAELYEPLADLISSGTPTLGTCAGMILLATEVLDGRSDQTSFGAIDLSVRRNGFGRQVASFETDLDVKGLDEPMHAVFIRAPLVERVGAAADVLAEVDVADARRPVVCAEGNVVVASFHPELMGDGRLHQLVLDRVEGD